jgi:hypothetical protein
MTLGRISLVSVSVGLAGVLAAAALAAKTPAHQTFHPANLEIAFELPSEWAGGQGRGRASKFFAVAPAHVADLEILASPTSLKAAAFATSFVNAERSVLLSGDPHAKIANHGLVVGAAVPATEIVATYRGFGEVTQAAGEKLVVVLYGFVHAGTAYILQFTTTDTWLPKLRGTFRESARSISFPFVT